MQLKPVVGLICSVVLVTAWSAEETSSLSSAEGPARNNLEINGSAQVLSLS